MHKELVPLYAIKYLRERNFFKNGVFEIQTKERSSAKEFVLQLFDIVMYSPNIKTFIRHIQELDMVLIISECE